MKKERNTPVYDKELGCPVKDDHDQKHRTNGEAMDDGVVKDDFSVRQRRLRLRHRSTVSSVRLERHRREDRKNVLEHNFHAYQHSERSLD